MQAKWGYPIYRVCDTSNLVLSAQEKYSKFKCYTDFHKMVEKEKPEAVFVATPIKFHFDFVKEPSTRNVHVFVEKPFCLSVAQRIELLENPEKDWIITKTES